MNRLVYIVLCVALFVGGCDLLNPSDFTAEVVVSGFLSAGDPLPEVRLTHTVPVGDAYDPKSAAVRNGDVRIQLLADDGSVEIEYEYQLQLGSSGSYRHENGDSTADWTDFSRPVEIVRPLRTYRLIADVPEFGRIISTTTVPDTFSVRSVRRDSVTYQSDTPFTFELTPPEFPGRQSVFIFTTTALDGFEHQLTPFAMSLLEDGDDVTLADLRERTSPILNEENFDSLDEALRIQFPWLAIYFYGRNRVSIQALDDNLYDFIRSHNVQQGGSTRPPGEIPNVIDPIDGGRGIFGSYAEASVDFYVHPREQ